ncbi:hypothetical protein CBR_g52356 [Chara braunii]|uniref:RNA polymerase II subunit A C-terminal domain phosphatase SSU72 n=1 Tax=Chara braunii TaxID=69332 RepID=A0A388K6T2_CHABU|nr:hypothetical protein CBR_g52356 [Chara braunii]|eukprot:GBG65765.1 hypothetical protein CBR_g52356 [Chara braunii]
MRLRFAMVCASNQNRSMEAHALLKKQGFDVASYGTATHVKLPGPSIREPNVYSFGTPYVQMHEELKRKDPDLYRRNGLLQMLKRNGLVKRAPQRWQDNAEDGQFDVVFTFEERVFDMVVEDLHNREQKALRSVLVVNLDVKDNHEEAAVGAKLALHLCEMLEATVNWEDEVEVNHRLSGHCRVNHRLSAHCRVNPRLAGTCRVIHRMSGHCRCQLSSTLATKEGKCTAELTTGCQDTAELTTGCQEPAELTTGWQEPAELSTGCQDTADASCQVQ